MLVMVRVEQLWWRGMVEMVGEWIGGGADDNGWAGGEEGRGYGGGCGGFSMVAGLGKEGEAPSPPLSPATSQFVVPPHTDLPCRPISLS
ncbi:unnamed protein product [Cuscuta campestris]|uniref:Uncharacterized protein n=1 Tax=Cuscuta campestris TaxID=132261 RepID=A0A484N893_9ASTE|nr:unnamed protein product [Cuscuta campestris]